MADPLSAALDGAGLEQAHARLAKLHDTLNRAARVRDALRERFLDQYGPAARPGPK